MATATKKLQVSARIVDTKRHTIGYVINGSELTVDEAITIARKGWVKGVRVLHNSGRGYLIGEDRKGVVSTRLYDLPIKIGF